MFADENGRLGESEPFETMESLQVTEIDDYLEAVLNKRRGNSTLINFMESPKNSRQQRN